jgi:hypothetical protein
MTSYVLNAVLNSLGQPLPTSLINNMITNEQYFRTPPQYGYTRSLVAANYTFTTTQIDIDGTNLVTTIVTTGNPVMAWLSAGKIGLGAAGTITIDLLVDGVSQSTLAGCGIYVMSGATEFKPLMLGIPILNLAAGSHVFKWQGKTSVNTATIYSANLIQTLIREM